LKTEIATVTGRQLWDSRGRPTVEAEVVLSDGSVGRALAPAGASRGDHEAVDLRDGGAAFGGFGVDGAVASAREPLWRYLAAGRPVRLPLPEIQIFGGGAHAGRRTDVQDFMIMAPRAGSFRRALEITGQVYFAAGKLMEARGPLTGVADEGGWWPAFASTEDALGVLTSAIEKAGFRPGEEVFISLDIAANEFHRDGRYHMAGDGAELDGAQMADRVAGWIRDWPILSVEDPTGQDDWETMGGIVRKLNNRVQVIGDDVLVTNAGRVERAASAGVCNAALIKVNQAGTVTEAKAALDAAKRAGWGTIVSARSGETEDVTIAHLAVGWDTGQLKVGSFTRSERMAKWNEVLRIEEALGADAVFAGGGALAQLEGWG